MDGDFTTDELGVMLRLLRKRLRYETRKLETSPVPYLQEHKVSRMRHLEDKIQRRMLSS